MRKGQINEKMLKDVALVTDYDGNYPGSDRAPRSGQANRTLWNIFNSYESLNSALNPESKAPCIHPRLEAVCSPAK